MVVYMNVVIHISVNMIAVIYYDWLMILLNKKGHWAV